MRPRQMAYKAPKAIASHPGVEECLYGPDEGIMEYKHAVWLKPHWMFRNGRMAGGRAGNFHSVKDFEAAKPVLNMAALRKVPLA